MFALIVGFAGGLGLFLYGMNVMAEGLQKSAGKRMQKLLQRITDNRLLGVLIGAAVTALIQSSSATTVMVVGFVNAGILSLIQAVGVIMGANIGTTITAWFVSLSQIGDALNPQVYAPLLIGGGAFAILLAKQERAKQIGQIVLGFGMLFFGLTLMADTLKPFHGSPVFVEAFTTLGNNPILAIIAGLVVTAIIQSSSASVGILQTLALSGMVSVEAAIYITLGQNIGTCVTALLSAIGAPRNAKRAAVIHFLFNVIGAVIFGIGCYVLFLFKPDFGSSPIDAVGISIFHTVFNVSNTIILFPAAKLLVRMSEILVRGKQSITETENARLQQALDPRLLENPAFALAGATREIIHMGQLAHENVEAALRAISTLDLSGMPKIYETEKAINRIEERVGEYLVRIESFGLTESIHGQISHLYYTLNDLERIGDHAENLAQIAESLKRDDLSFSETALADLKTIGDCALATVQNAVQSREKMESALCVETQDGEGEVDRLEQSLREAHLERMVNGVCTPGAGVHFLDTIANLERISDHAKNIAGYVWEELHDSSVFAHTEEELA